MVDFPADIIIEILSQLPVTSLLRFRSISKSWQSLIDGHYFKTLHLNKSNKSKTNLILRDYSKFYVVDFPTLNTAVKLSQPLNSLKCSITILGSCNGLLCLKNILGDIIIWNPSLRKHWILPHLPTSHPRIYDFGFGFGFDPLTGDYKLVTISYICRVASTYESKVYLFSCRTNVWKTLPNVPYVLTWFESNGVFVDHALHWVAVKGIHERDNLIVAFDLRFEVFNEVPLPELGEGFEIYVSHLDRCLSMVVSYQNQNTIWVMKQYGCKDSWFKRFNLVQSFESKLLKIVKPLGYYSDDDNHVMKVLLKKEYPNMLFSYNLKSKQVSVVTISRISNFDFVDAIIWVESLVQPHFPSEAAKAKAAAGVGMQI